MIDMMADPARKPAPHYHPLVRHVARGLRQRCAVPAGAHLLVAVSAGADSVALLRALALLAPRRKFGLKLTVAHVNHHLRGEHSNADALFVQTLANQLKLPCHITGVHLEHKPGNLEAAARDARYDALTKTALQCGASYIATAHHADDQLETLLMRFIRGASVAGLRGIAHARPIDDDPSSLHLTLVRPMLNADRADARAFLGTLGQRWREDATNTDTARLRNRLRHEVVPILKDIRNDAAAAAVQLADHFADLHDLVQDQTDAARPPKSSPASYSLDTPPPTGPAPADQDPAPLEAPDPQAPSRKPQAPAHFSLTRAQARAMPPLILTQTLRQHLIQLGTPPDALPGHALRPVLNAIQDTTGGERTFTFANQTTITLTRDAVEAKRET